MEGKFNPFPNNQPEKPESSKREKIELEIDGVKIEGEKYYFEYPERIQKETGILGYERTIIPAEQLPILSNFGEKFPGIKSMSDFENADLSDRFAVEREINKSIGTKLLPYLSNNEYPNYSFNHIRSYYTGQEDRIRHKESFQESFFLEKLYDLDRTKEESEHREYPFSYSQLTTGDNSSSYTNIDIYDSKSDEKTSEGDHLSFGEVVKFEEDIRNKKVYAVTVDSGLSLAVGQFFRGNSQVMFENNVCFGFAFKADSFMEEYYEKTFCDLVRKGYFNFEYGKTRIPIGLKSAASHVLLNRVDWSNLSLTGEEWTNQKVERGFVSKWGGEWNTEVMIRDCEEVDYLRSILIKNNIQIDEAIEKSLVFVAREHFVHMWRILREATNLLEEDRLPIYIGHDEIPQLSWGHATYANYMNEKGFNFFKFKHADHLPTKE